jgi:hypothetical protein
MPHRDELKGTGVESIGQVQQPNARKWSRQKHRRDVLNSPVGLTDEPIGKESRRCPTPKLERLFQKAQDRVERNKYCREKPPGDRETPLKMAKPLGLDPCLDLPGSALARVAPIKRHSRPPQRPVVKADEGTAPSRIPALARRSRGYAKSQKNYDISQRPDNLLAKSRTIV